MWILYLEEMWELEEAHEGEVSPVGPAVDGHPVDVHVRVIATQPRQDLDLKRKKTSLFKHIPKSNKLKLKPQLLYCCVRPVQRCVSSAKVC